MQILKMSNMQSIPNCGLLAPCCSTYHISSRCRYKSEVSQQKILFRGSFGTQRPGGARHNAFDIFMKNAANTSIVHWNGRLLALFEAAQPVAMDPYTLQTLGPDLLGGNVSPGAAFHFGKLSNRLTGKGCSCVLSHFTVAGV